VEWECELLGGTGLARGMSRSGERGERDRIWSEGVVQEVKCAPGAGGGFEEVGYGEEIPQNGDASGYCGSESRRTSEVREAEWIGRAFGRSLICPDPVRVPCRGRGMHRRARNPRSRSSSNSTTRSCLVRTRGARVREHR
jgi:hypothetical protein